MVGIVCICICRYEFGWGTGKYFLFLPESKRFLHCDGHLVLQGVVGLVRGQVEAVEASVGLGEGVGVARFLDREASGSVGSLKVFESVDGDTGSTCGELEETGLLFRVPGADNLPEVLDDFVLLLVAAVVGVLLPVVNVDVGDTADEKLEFSLVEDVHQIRRDQLIEAGHECVKLLLDPLDDLPLRDQSE